MRIGPATSVGTPTPLLKSQTRYIGGYPHIRRTVNDPRCTPRSATTATRIAAWICGCRSAQGRTPQMRLQGWNTEGRAYCALPFTPCHVRPVVADGMQKKHGAARCSQAGSDDTLLTCVECFDDARRRKHSTSSSRIIHPCAICRHKRYRIALGRSALLLNQCWNCSIPQHQEPCNLTAERP